MQINNNFNNNRQINFKSDLKAADRVLEDIVPRIAQIAKNKKGTEGGTVFVSHFYSPAKQDTPASFTTRFAYFEKDDVFARASDSVAFETPKAGVFKLIEGFKYAAEDFDSVGRWDKVVEKFEEFMDSVPKK